MHLGDFYTPSPKDYKKENIEDVEKETKEQVSDAQDKANVILIMNESFSDPNKIKNVEYSINPFEEIENLYKNEKNCYVLEIATPVLGGGTSLPEFEGLTGLTSFYLSEQIFPYTTYIRSDMNSIVREYRDSGYKTIGLHTYKGDFYNRRNVYKYLGFDKMIFEEDMDNPEIKGKYISDNEFGNQIIKQFEETKEKKFIFGVTMQNHMPYTSNRYEKLDIEIKSDIYSKEQILELRNYVQGVYDGNKMYLKLVEYIKDYDEKTILVMFGDHLPALENKYIYEKSELSEADYFLTPCIIWANYDIDIEEIFPVMSPGNLSIKIANTAGIKLPWYYQKFNELYEKYPSINNKIAISKDYRVIGSSLVEKDELIKKCEILQYDLLIKKKYIPIK